jgi:hypothetical protein
MNERIEELAKECYVKTGSEHTDHFAYWKFAELIVKECCHKLENDGMVEVAMEMKQYFKLNH